MDQMEHWKNPYASPDQLHAFLDGSPLHDLPQLLHQHLLPDWSSCQLLLAVQPVAPFLVLPHPCLVGLASFLLLLLHVCHAGDVQPDVDARVRYNLNRQNLHGHQCHLEDSYCALQSHSLAFSFSLGQFSCCHLLAFCFLLVRCSCSYWRSEVAATGDLKSETALITSASFFSM